MEIDLSTIPTCVIADPRDRRRYRHITALLDHLDVRYKVFPPIRCKPGIIGCGLSHLRILREGTPPFLVLEDDCELTPYFRRTLEVPEEAAALYLGVSSWGRIPEIHPDRGINYTTVATIYRGEFLRVHNMLGTHAILYLKESFVHPLRERMLECILSGVPFDIACAALQRSHVVLTPRRPFFYQDANLGGEELSTNIRLHPIGDLASLDAVHFQGWRQQAPPRTLRSTFRKLSIGVRRKAYGFSKGFPWRR